MTEGQLASLRTKKGLNLLRIEGKYAQKHTRGQRTPDYNWGQHETTQMLLVPRFDKGNAKNICILRPTG